MARSARRPQRSRPSEPELEDEDLIDDEYEEEDDDGYDDDEGDYVSLDEIDPHDGLRGFSRTPFVTLLALSLVIHAAVIVGTSVPWLMGFSEPESVVEETFESAEPPARETPAAPEQEPRAQPERPEPQEEGEGPDSEGEENEHIRRLQESEPAPGDGDATREAQDSLDRLTLP